MENNFEQEWEQAFEQAYIFPPVKVWENIEKQLPKAKRRPFWAWIGVFLASVTLIGSGWFVGKNSTNFNKTTTRQSKIITQKSFDDKLALKQIEDSKILKNRILSQEKQNKEVSNLKSLGQSNIHKSLAKKEDKSLGFEQIFKADEQSNQVFMSPKQTDRFDTTPTVDITQNSKIEKQTFENLVSKNIKIAYSLIPLPDVGFEAKLEKAKIKKEKFWLGLQFSTISFNPGINVLYQTQAALANSNDYTASSVSEPKISFLIEANLGHRINDKFFWESGLSFLRGNSTLYSNSFLVNRLNSSRNNLYANAIGVSQATPVANFNLDKNLNISNAFVPAAQVIGQENRFSYLVVPLLLGYEFFEMNRFSVSAMAGMSADVFLSNDISSTGSLNASSFVASDGVYKVVNFSGLASLRASYQVGLKTHLLFESNYRNALANGLNQDSDVKIRPHSAGFALGLQYKF